MGMTAAGLVGARRLDDAAFGRAIQDRTREMRVIRDRQPAGKDIVFIASAGVWPGL